MSYNASLMDVFDVVHDYKNVEMRDYFTFSLQADSIGTKVFLNLCVHDSPLTQQHPSS